MARQIGELLHALEDGDQPVRDLAGRRPAVFLDYDAPRSTGIFVERADDRGWPSGPLPPTTSCTGRRK